jgi:hypothetical protein
MQKKLLTKKCLVGDVSNIAGSMHEGTEFWRVGKLR